MPRVQQHHLLALTIWALLVSACFGVLFHYANTPGESAKAAAASWPAGTRLETDPKTATLVVFAHPRCPCSDASVGELERLVPYFQGKVKGYVVFFAPKSKPEDWAKEALWRKARAIPGVGTILDEDGVEASRFGARTSGQTFLYDLKGNLVFRGGITPERGHRGDSDGRAAILAFIETGKIKISETPVFGCSLKNLEWALAGEVK